MYRQGLRMKTAEIFDGMEFSVVRGVLLRSGSPHVGENFGGRILSLGRPRCGGRVEHRLINILVIAVCAVIAGAESWEDIALHGRKDRLVGPISRAAQWHPSPRHLPTCVHADRYRAFLEGLRGVGAIVTLDAMAGDRHQDSQERGGLSGGA